VMSLYQDATGLVWIGTRAGGVSRWNPRSWELGGHRPAWLGDKLVTAFAEAPDNKVWIASLGGGLTLYDDDSGKATAIDAIAGRRTAPARGARSARPTPPRSRKTRAGISGSAPRAAGSTWRARTVPS